MSLHSKETINKSLEKFISRFEEIYGITVSDTEGAVFSRVIRNDAPVYLPMFPVQLAMSQPTPSTEPALLMSIDPLSVGFSKSAQLIERLGMGRPTVVTSVYGDYIAFQVYFSPLIVTIIATTEINRGMVHSIIPELKEKLQDIRAELNSSKRIDYDDH